MNEIDARRDLRPVSGQWRTFEDILVWDTHARDIYRSTQEPSYVSWAVLWKETESAENARNADAANTRDTAAALKLSFTEVVGDPAIWPPAYDFNPEGILKAKGVQYHVKTLVSHDEGRSWRDTGWREDLRGIPHGNSDHKTRVVCQLRDGTLIRNSWRSTGETVMRYNYLYDESKAATHFPFTENGPVPLPVLTTSTSRSVDGGRTWEEIHLHRGTTPFLADAIRQLRDGSIVATGALLREWSRAETYQVVLVESRDGGRTWSAPQVIAENDDALAPQIMGEESDFVELSDGRLLLVERTDGTGMNMVQMYLSRDGGGKWRATRPSTNPAFVHSGFPHMCRASDGTIFCYFITAMLYTCDDGATWKSMPFGTSYYGELVESSPGRIVAVTQTHIGDSPYPWRHDTAMRQSSFRFKRIGVAEQTDASGTGAVAALGNKDHADFHIFAEVRVDGEAGIAFNMKGDAFWFAAVVIPCNEFRAPGRAAGKEQDAMLMIGRCTAGSLNVRRRQWLGKIVPGAWVKMQLDLSGNVLKAAVKTATESAGESAATYTVMRDDFGAPGKLGLFTNMSTGAFKNIRIGAGSTEIRSNWGTFAGDQQENGQDRDDLPHPP